MSSLTPIRQHLTEARRAVDWAVEAAVEDARPGFVPRLAGPAAAEAKDRLETLRAGVADVARLHPDRVERWLYEVNASCSPPIGEVAMGYMLQGVLRASGDVPGAAFNAETLAAACRRIDRLSSRAVDAVVRPAARVMWGQVRALEALVSAAAAVEAERAQAAVEPTDAERAAIIEAFRAKMRAPAAIVDDGVPARNGALSRELLIAAAERTIVSGVEPYATLARARLDGLRAMTIPGRMRDGSGT